MCVKTYKAGTQNKFFINICHTTEIPAPKDITENELLELIKQQRPSDFKIALSLSKPRFGTDKSNNKVEVTDVAVNTDFYKKKVTSGGLFYQFLITLIFEHIEQKYEIKIDTDNFVVLNNRPFIEQLVEHQIYNRDIKFVENFDKNEMLGEEDEDKNDKIIIGNGDKNTSGKVLIQEITTKSSPASSKKKEDKDKENTYKPNLIKESISQANTCRPEYRLAKDFDIDENQVLIAEFYLPEVKSLSEVTLDISNDRLLLESRKHSYMFDGFLPQLINEDKTEAEFDNERMVSIVEFIQFLSAFDFFFLLDSQSYHDSREEFEINLINLVFLICILLSLYNKLILKKILDLNQQVVEKIPTYYLNRFQS